MKALLIVLPLISWLCVSCTGYKLGGNKPSYLSHVKKIQVPLFVNKTQLTRAEAYATNSAVDAIVRDGTYAIGNAETADAVLVGTIENIRYSQVSSSRSDSLRSEELSMTIDLHWELHDAQNPAKILKKGTSQGTTRLFAGANLQEARTNALPDALRRACESMVSQFSDGF